MEILIISGLSGGGKSSAATFLEDMGYYTVDNMPPEIIPKFAEFCAESDGRYDRVALVCDVRGGREHFDTLFQVTDRLKESGVLCRLLFLYAELGTIIKRYKETRRRHPLMSAECTTVEDAVHREEALLAPLRARADFLIDTTQMPTAKLRSELLLLFGDKEQHGALSVSVMSFGYKYGLPLEADLVFDVRFMPNPFYVPELRDKTGMDEEVYRYVFGFEQARVFEEKLEAMLSYLLPLYTEEGKSMLVVAIGCTGGKHRSVSIARAISAYLKKNGYSVQEHHRDLGR